MCFCVLFEGEIIKKFDVNCGYIYCGIEKMNESFIYLQILVLIDWFDYLGVYQNCYVFCMCIEKVMGIEVSECVKYICIIMDEFQCIDFYFLFYFCFVMDLGVLIVFFYGFCDCEMILDMFEEICGGCLIMNYNIIGGVQVDLYLNFILRVKKFIFYLCGIIYEYYDVFIGNVIVW